jgi:hypothetical protein
MQRRLFLDRMAKRSKLPAKRNPASAADAYRGFSLQATRIVVHLLRAQPGSYVSLEVFDDVGVEAPDGTRIAEQDTSSLARNPVSNRSPKFWKTIANWLQAVVSGMLDVKRTLFVLHVSGTSGGHFIEVFSEAASRDKALDLAASARAFLGDPDLPHSLKPFAARILPVDAEIFAELIVNFSLSSEAGNPTDEIRQLMSITVVPDEIINDVTVHCLGFVKERLDTLLHESKPAVICADDFRSDLKAYVRRYDRRTILASFAGIPEKAEIDSHQVRTYVRQLTLVDCDDDDKIAANLEKP